MRTAAALRIVCIGLLQEGQRLVFGVAKGTRLATRGRRAWLDRNGGHRRSGDVMWLCCRRAACKPGAARALRITFAYYGLGTLSPRARRAATAQRESGVARCYVVRRRSRLPLRRHLLGGPEHAQDVEPRQLPHVGLTPSPPQPLGEQIGELRDVFKPDR